MEIILAQSVDDGTVLATFEGTDAECRAWADAHPDVDGWDVIWTYR